MGVSHGVIQRSVFAASGTAGQYIQARNCKNWPQNGRESVPGRSAKTGTCGYWAIVMEVTGNPVKDTGRQEMVRGP